MVAKVLSLAAVVSAITASLVASGAAEIFFSLIVLFVVAGVAETVWSR